VWYFATAGCATAPAAVIGRADLDELLSNWDEFNAEGR
jgi:hypothetical protein